MQKKIKGILWIQKGIQNSELTDGRLKEDKELTLSIYVSILAYTLIVANDNTFCTNEQGSMYKTNL